MNSAILFQCCELMVQFELLSDTLFLLLFAILIQHCELTAHWQFQLFSDAILPKQQNFRWFGKKDPFTTVCLGHAFIKARLGPAFIIAKLGPAFIIARLGLASLPILASVQLSVSH